MSMSASSIRHRLEHLIALTGLLERIEQRHMDVGAEQYRRAGRSLGSRDARLE